MLSDEKLDRADAALHAAQARLTGGLSLAAGMLAAGDWAVHWANAPGHRARVAAQALRDGASVAAYGAALALHPADPPKAPLPPRAGDHRFDNEGWARAPFALWAQGFTLAERVWDSAVNVAGVSPHHRDLMRYGGRQVLDMMSPSNLPWTNPEVARRTMATGGMNLVRGAANFWDDWRRQITGEKPAGVEAFTVGENLAATPGKVVFRNELIELIQYAPTTASVRPEPVLFVPAWIMKYYILDLSEQNSMVRWLVGQGFTVFMISWKNPGEADQALGMEDYARKGVLAALEAVQAIVPGPKVHSVGYCIGGTLLSLVAALEGKERRDRLASVTLFAAQMEFSDAGELRLFIDESQLHFLEDMMTDRGYLDDSQMAGAFRMLRSNDLIWSRMVHDYLMGDRAPVNDLMAWNADATRMPARMHSQYLRRLFMGNDFALGRYRLMGQGIAPPDIAAPIFQVGTETDHVAPWRSAFKVAMLTDVEVTFVLTNGGHNAGIVSPPDHPRRRFRKMVHQQGQPHQAADEWFAATDPQKGSWWPEWAAWLAAHSGAPVAPPAMGNAAAGYGVLCDAPGEYVRG